MINDSGVLKGVPVEYVTETELNGKGYKRGAKVTKAITIVFFFFMMRRPPGSTRSGSSAASDVYKRQAQSCAALRCVIRAES